MLFNLHNGQVRFGALDKGSKPYFRPKMKVGHISIGKIKGQQGNIEHDGGYKVDRLGNIDVTVPFHIDTMIGNGWPIYIGKGIIYPATERELLYPDNNLNSLYWQKILEAKNMRRE